MHRGFVMTFAASLNSARERVAVSGIVSKDVGERKSSPLAVLAKNTPNTHARTADRIRTAHPCGEPYNQPLSRRKVHEGKQSYAFIEQPEGCHSHGLALSDLKLIAECPLRNDALFIALIA
jgi:hypothetical protein